MNIADHKSFALSTSQLGIWMGQKINPTDPLYNMIFRFDLQTKIDQKVFQKAFGILVEKSDAMRCVFVEDSNSVPKIIIKDQLEYNFAYHDFSETESPSSHVESWIDERKAIIFQLEERLFDSALLKVREEHYVWYINQHHLITDAWSYTVQFEALLDIYDGLTRDDRKEYAYPKFLDYLNTLPEISTSKRVKDARLFWNDKFRNSKPPFILSTDEEVYKSKSTRNAFTLKLETSNKLRSLAQEPNFRTWSLDLSIYNIFLSILFSTASEFATQNSIVVGSPISNRNTPTSKNTVGLFMELFPIQVDLEKEETYLSLFKKVNVSTNTFLKHGVGGSSTSLGSRSFNLVLNYINASFAKFDQFPTVATWLHSGHNDPNHYIQLQISDFNKKGMFDLAFDFNDSRFSAEEKSQIEDIFKKHLIRFLNGYEDLIFENVGIVPELIEQTNNNKLDYPAGVSILDLFAEQVEKCGEKTALIFGEGAMSFRELDWKSSQLAHFLRNKGITQENTVAICLERSFEMMIGILGILKAGAAYVPLDVDYPDARIRFIYDDSESKLILTNSAFLSKFSFLSEKEKYIFDRDSQQLVSQSKEVPILDKVLESLMYIIYTSGSTGTPKGVMNQHDGVMNRLWWGMHEFKLTSEDVVLQKTNYTFDVSVNELFLPLITGCKLVLAAPNGHRDSSYLKAVIEKEKVSLIHFVPTMLEVFLDHVKKGDCSSLRIQLCSGEALESRSVQLFNELFPTTDIYNLYGPTEAAIEVSMWKATKGKNQPANIPIGKALPNVELYILNEENRHTVVDEKGELLIGGIQVARGYKNRLELNRTKFVADFIKPGPGRKLFRTGDLCSRAADGNIYFFGRMDNQVKFRGNRIELGEIKSVALELNTISDAIVLIHKFEHDEKQMIMFYAAEKPIQSDIIKINLLQKLPIYMIPSKIYWVKKLPLLINGKIDRQKLILSIESSETRSIISEELNEFEELIANVWKDVLNISHLSKYDDFFNIGGESLSGIRVISNINASLEIDIPVVTIFQKSTIFELAQFVESEIDRLMMEMEEDEPAVK